MADRTSGGLEGVTLAGRRGLPARASLPLCTGSKTTSLDGMELCTICRLYVVFWNYPERKEAERGTPSGPEINAEPLEESYPSRQSASLERTTLGITQRAGPGCEPACPRSRRRP